MTNAPQIRKKQVTDIFRNGSSGNRTTINDITPHIVK